MLIGLTGGISSGKSTITKILKEKGYTVVDVDKESKLIIDNSKEIKKEIREFFGDSVFFENGELNRKVLGSIVFNDNQKLLKLNEITHPRIKENLSSLVKRMLTEHNLVFVDHPLLIETGFYKEIDKVILVSIRKEVQIKRLMKRNGLSESEVIERIDSQMSLIEKAEKSDYIIDNNDTEFEPYRGLRKQINNILSKLFEIEGEY